MLGCLAAFFINAGGADLADDLRRGRLIRSIIDDPQWQQDLLPPDVRRLRVPDGPALSGKNAGPTGAVLMIDANQVWDVQQAIDYVSSLAEIKPWFIEEPTAPDDILGHAAIRRALKPLGIGQLFQADAIDVCQIDSCRLAGVSEVLSVLFMATNLPHAGGVGLCEYVNHGRNVLEYVDHLHEHFLHPCSINDRGRYNVPTTPLKGIGYVTIEMYQSSIAKYEWPNGSYWALGKGKCRII
ncbi:enolase C-terminal domain-like protein [Russula vinacea]|nr:enolase C-terminal domain-like protein [Russula vinacea]